MLGSRLAHEWLDGFPAKNFTVDWLIQSHSYYAVTAMMSDKK